MLFFQRKFQRFQDLLKGYNNQKRIINVRLDVQISRTEYKIQKYTQTHVVKVDFEKVPR